MRPLEPTFVENAYVLVMSSRCQRMVHVGCRVIWAQVVSFDIPI